MPFQKGEPSQGPSPRGNGDQAWLPSPHPSGQPATAGPSTPSVAAPFGVPAAGAPNRRSPGWYAARSLEEVEAAERRLERPANADELVAQFMDCTSTDVDLAEEYIQNNGWDLEVALEQFWMAVHPESSDDELSELESGDSGTWEKSAEEDNGDGEGAGEEVKDTWRRVRPSARKSAKGNKRFFTDENPNVDRSAAKKGRRDESKLTIRLMRDGQPFVSTHEHVVDWSKASDIIGLNKFRQQIFRRILGPVRHGVVPFLPEEDQYLVDIHRAGLQANGGSSRRLSLQWDRVVEDFNARFAGRVLDGSDKPRPTRSKGSLQSQCRRIPEISELTGKKPRSTKRRGQSEEDSVTPQPKRRDNDDSDDEDEDRPIGKF